MFQDLRLSADQYGIDIHPIPQERTEPPDPIKRPDFGRVRRAKVHKSKGILNARGGCERTVFVDAHTQIVDPTGINAINGS